LFFLILLPFILYSQDNQDSTDILNKSIKLYLDCSNCDNDFIRREIQFVNYVRIQQEADVFVLETRQSTAANGYELVFYFIGQNSFQGINDTLKLIFNTNETSDNLRRNIVQKLKLGLMKYISKNDISKYISINFDLPPRKEEVEDNWKQWFFKISSDIYTNGEKMFSSINLWSDVSASKINENWKFEFSLSNNYNSSSYKLDDTTTLISETQRYSFNNLIVKSLSEHWSIGEQIYLNSSNYSNIKFGASFLPAIEFNVFPFSESSRNELRFLYGIGVKQNYYIDTTIYLKTEELLFLQSLKMGFQKIEQWGSAGIYVYWSNYLNNFKLNNLSFNTYIRWRIIGGLSININGGVSFIHDQINLRKSAASNEEILTRCRQLESQYSYWLSSGLSFTFGSIFNNIVNPRFDL
jgi:hypothetical protein